MVQRTCSVDGCDRAHYGHGFCQKHWRRWKTRGTATKPQFVRPPCSVEGCTRLARARGLCTLHYQRMRSFGSLEAPPRPDRTQRACKIDGCSKSVWACDMCNMHYNRLRATGEIGSPLPLAAPRGSGCTRKDGYRILMRKGHPIAAANGQVLEHRVVLYDLIGPGGHPCHWCGTVVVWERSYPEHPDGLVVDHFDFDKGNNVPHNLFPTCGSCNLRRSPP